MRSRSFSSCYPFGDYLGVDVPAEFEGYLKDMKALFQLRKQVVWNSPSWVLVEGLIARRRTAQHDLMMIDDGTERYDDLVKILDLTRMELAVMEDVFGL